MLRRLELCATLCCEKRKHNKHYAYDTISLRVKGGSNANTHLPFNSGSGAPLGGAVLRARLSCAQTTVCGNGPCEAARFALPLRTPAPLGRTLGYAPPYNCTDARRAVLCFAISVLSCLFISTAFPSTFLYHARNAVSVVRCH